MADFGASALAATLRACAPEGEEHKAISTAARLAADMLERHAAQLAALRAGADTEDLHAVPARAAMDVVDIAGIIYDACFLPGEEEDGYVMPPFEDAVRDGLGGSDRALVAARTIARQFRETGSAAAATIDVAAIRRQALEEAALAVETGLDDIVGCGKPGGEAEAIDLMVRTMRRRAAAIRALADKPAAGGEA